MRRGDVAAVSEMIACVDLMRRGWDVYQAVSPQCPGDLVITAGRRMLRVKVRTGRLSGAGTCVVVVRDDDRFDVLAVVVGDRAGYLPDPDGARFPWPITEALAGRVAALAGT